MFAILEENGDFLEVQDVLLTVVEDDSFYENDRLRALVALGGITKISFLSVQRLMQRDVTEQESELPANILLTIGTIRSTADNPEVRTAADNFLMTQLTTAADYKTDNNMHLKNVLKGMANAGNPGFLENVSRYFYDEDPYVKQFAIETMRSMPPEKTDHILHELLVSEDNIHKAAAVKTLGFRTSFSKQMNEFLFERLHTEQIIDIKVKVAECLLKQKNNYDTLLQIAQQADVPLKLKLLLLQKIPIKGAE